MWLVAGLKVEMDNTATMTATAYAAKEAAGLEVRGHMEMVVLMGVRAEPEEGWKVVAVPVEKLAD